MDVSRKTTTGSQEDPMLPYETHPTRHAELVREARAEGLARAVRAARKAARGSGRGEPEGRVDPGWRDQLATAA
ncbi:hypothetical protein [Streptomyces sp. NPDC047097]|uniref:hypothetical protein n=1 Tax=Streptomyces sp. NPDC047097 TaxID=3155260 RepID=UPI0033C8C167